ncbi:MAG: hypothetical protein EXS59_02770 [Candidatus Taylorbacteria bacterium]|nr:hypothetical protein [Candidatus Taylorbacteria bacterium]
MLVNKGNVGKIAERIVMNELQFRGYQTTDLNKDGLRANADILASKDGKVWQIQVKGATNTPTGRWWVQYGHCDPDILSGKAKVFNRKESFYSAAYVALVAVRSPSEYRCFILPVAKAEKIAQLGLDRGYREPKRDGSEHKPGKMWTVVERSDKDRTRDPRLNKEREILQSGENQWNLL